jgi:hypothetical protein
MINPNLQKRNEFSSVAQLTELPNSVSCPGSMLRACPMPPGRPDSGLLPLPATIGKRCRGVCWGNFKESIKIFNTISKKIEKRY